MAGCTNSTSNNIADLTKRDNISITDFVDCIDVIQLESSEQALFNSIDKIISYGDYYYIFDARQQSVLCFDHAGDFKYKINSVGRGPEEYVYIGYFNIDPYNNRLMLLQPMGAIFYYDLDGKFIEKISLPSECGSYNEVHSINEDTLLFVSLYEFDFVYYSSTDNKIVKQIFPIDRDILPPEPLGRVYQYQDSIYFASVVSENETYNLSTNTISIDYKWDFGKLNYTKRQIQTLYNDYIAVQRANMMPLYFNDLVKEGRFIDYFIMSSRETNRYRIASVSVDNGAIYVVYDKNNKKSYVIDKTTEGIQPYFTSRNVTNESFILWDYGPSFQYKYYDLSVLNDQQKGIINNHNPEQDNPFLVVYHLKQ